MTNTGNLNVISRILSVIGEDMASGTEEEAAAGVVLDALQVAITTGATSELAALVKPWTDEKLLEAVRSGSIGSRGIVEIEAEHG